MSVPDYANPWHREGVETLAVLMWKSGKSSGQIANELSLRFKYTFTRNAVIGRISRLGLRRGAANQPKGATKVQPLTQFTKPRKPRPYGVPRPRNQHTKATVIQARIAGAQLPPARKTVVPPAEIAVAPRLWMTREPRECCWPVDGEGEQTRSCCNPTDGRHYCAPHYSIAYRPSVNKPEPEEFVRRRAA